MTHEIIHGRAGETANNLSPDAGFDLYRLDCAADALRSGPPLHPDDRAELRRIIENLMSLLETVQ